MNTKCDASELKYQLLQKFYELAKEPEKWEEGVFGGLVNGVMCVERIGHIFEITCSSTGNIHRSESCRYALHVSNAQVAESGFKTVEVEPERREKKVTKSSSSFWSGPHYEFEYVTIPAVTETIPDDFHQTCASLFAAWEDWQECVKLTEALQSLSPSPKGASKAVKAPKAKPVKQPSVEVKAVPAKRPRKAPLASAAGTKPKSPSSSKK